jgi:uncharacterized protein YneF (UPF0154 family)
MDFSNINWLAVIVSALAFYGIGAIWYSFLFRKAWMKEVNLNPEDARNANMVKIMSLTFLFSLVMVTNLAVFISGPDIGASEGVMYGFLTGFGWVAMAMALNALYEMRSWKYILINTGYMVVGFTVSGLILGAWK